MIQTVLAQEFPGILTGENLSRREIRYCQEKPGELVREEGRTEASSNKGDL